MIALGLLFLCLCGLCYGVSRWWRVPAPVAPAVVVGVVTGLLFLADFAALLRPASLLLAGVGLVGAVDAIRIGWRKVKCGGLPPLIANPRGMIWAVVILLFFTLYAINRHHLFYQWDEFSHWGTVIRSIVEADTFHFRPNPLYFQDYPPGTALFAYFVLTLLGYSEGGAYFAYALILLAHCIPLYGLACRRGYFPLALAVAASLALVRLLGHGWSSVLIDHVLSVCFAGVVASYLVIREENAPRWPLAFLFVSLVLAKHAGTSLALVACGVIVIDSLVIAAASSRADGAAVKWGTIIGRAGWPWLVLPLPALALSTLWNHYVEVENLARGYGRFGVSELLQRSLGCCVSEREQTIVFRYLDRWLGLPESLSLSLPVPGASGQSVLFDYLSSRVTHLGDISGYSPALLTLGFASAALVGVFCSTLRVDRIRQGATLVALGGASLLFAGVQLLFYLYAFSEYEAMAIASFKRFQNTYYLAWALSALAWLAIVVREPHQAAAGRGRSRWRNVIYWSLVVVVLLGGGRALVGGKIGEAQRAERINIRDWVESLTPPLEVGSRVYIVWQGSNGFEFWETYHELLPRMTNRDCYSLGPRHFDGDIWSCPYDEPRLRAEWSNYDFVLVARGYADLQRNYPGIVPDLGQAVERELLRVERDGDVLRLRKAP